MEYAADGTLKDRTGSSLESTVEYVAPAATGLAEAHEARIVHLDIKPSNVLILGETAKLADFGIAVASRASIISMAYTLAHTPPETFTEATDTRDENYGGEVIRQNVGTGNRGPNNPFTSNQSNNGGC